MDRMEHTPFSGIGTGVWRRIKVKAVHLFTFIAHVIDYSFPQSKQLNLLGLSRCLVS